MGGGVQNAVQDDQARFFVQLVLVLAALGDLDDRHKVFRLDPVRRNVMPNVHENQFLLSYHPKIRSHYTTPTQLVYQFSPENAPLEVA